MSRVRLSIAAVAIGLLVVAVVPAVSSGGPGKLVGKDTNKSDPPLAVVQETVKNPGKLTAVVTGSPKSAKIQWGYTTDCVRGDETSEWPPPGTHTDKIEKGPVREKLKTGGLPNADECTVAVSGKLTAKSAKKVTVKIFNK